MAGWPGLLVLLLVLLTSCVRVPTSGPVEKVTGEQPDCADCLVIKVDPPSPGDSPQAIVEGYLRATSNYQPNYSVAKQYLTSAAVQTWSPEDGVSIYTGTLMARGNTVRLDGRLLGSLGPDRTYTARDAPLRVDFGLVQESGEWRISRPPPGLLVVDYAFMSFYRPYDLYFLGNNATLVPDPIYLPDLRSQTGLASVLMKALLGGPSAWLRPAVATALPPNTALSVDSVTVEDGVATVPLSDTVLRLADQQRAEMAAQVLYTLKQAAGIQGVAFTVDSQPFRVPGADPETGVLTMDAVSRELEPVPYVSGTQLYAVRDRRVGVVTENAGRVDSQPIPGRLGQGAVVVDSLAVSVTNTDLAAVTDARTRVVTTTIADGGLNPVLQGVTELLRPQYTRFGELWVVGRKAGRQRLWVVAGGRVTEALAPALDNRVQAFAVSPDGSRVAIVRRLGSGSELGLARVTRAARVSVDGWRPVDLTRSNITRLTQIADLSWVDATDLLVLGAESPNEAFSPYRVSQDASTITPRGESTAWDAETLTTLLRTQNAVVVGRRGQAWRDDGASWVPFLDKVSAAAFPG